jgi:hypothetical protein
LQKKFIYDNILQKVYLLKIIIMTPEIPSLPEKQRQSPLEGLLPAVDAKNIKRAVGGLEAKTAEIAKDVKEEVGKIRA